MRVTIVPAHMLLLEGETVTPTGKFGFTIIMIVFEVAGLLDIQVEIEEVMVQ